MIDQQALGIKSFEDEKDEAKLLLILDDIEASKKQINSLENEKNSLSTELENLTFHLRELRIQRDLLSSPPEPLSQEENIQNAEENFFPYYNTLENRESEHEARLEGQRQITANLNHKLNEYHQKNKSLKEELRKLEEEDNKLDDDILTSNNALVDLNIQLDSSIKENEFIIQKCEELKNELEERDSHLKENVMVQYETLTAKYKKDQLKLAELKKKTSKLQADISRHEKKAQDDFDLEKERCEKEAAISYWKNDRGVLKNKLKNLKAQLYSVQANLEKSKKRDEDLNDKYTKLLGENHNFGECELAKKCLLYDISDATKEKEITVSSKDYDYELEYSEQLLKELECIDKSLEVFHEYRDSQISSLNQELSQCSQIGFLTLLKEELAELQSQLLNLQ